MNIQQLSDHCQKNFKQSLKKDSWMHKGIYFVRINLPNGLVAEASEKVDRSKPDGYYKTNTLQLAVDEAVKMLSISTLSDVSEKEIESKSYFPDTNKGRAAFRKCMATAIIQKKFTLDEANQMLCAPFTGTKEAQNLAGQLRFGDEMTLEDIQRSGKKQTNQSDQFFKNAGWMKEHGRLASEKN